jgi:fatty aldehyde-generating acyl-ACP reductase
VETIALALEDCFEDYALGKEISRQRVEEITAMAKKHGFRLIGFRSFERDVTEQQIEAVRQRARRRVPGRC